MTWVSGERALGDSVISGDGDFAPSFTACFWLPLFLTQVLVVCGEEGSHSIHGLSSLLIRNSRPLLSSLSKGMVYALGSS